jgi:hypothetical protein
MIQSVPQKCPPQCFVVLQPVSFVKIFLYLIKEITYCLNPLSLIFGLINRLPSVKASCIAEIEIEEN